MNTVIVIATVVILLGFYYLGQRKKPNKLHIRNQRKAKVLLEKLQRGNFSAAYTFGILRKIDPFVFEELLLLCFKNKGFKVLERQSYVNDGGEDGQFYDKDGNYFLIQAKRYKSAINPAHVKDFANLIEQRKATGGYFIHTGRTGKKSYQNSTNKIKIISGDKLLALIRTSVVSDKHSQPYQKSEKARYGYS